MVCSETAYGNPVFTAHAEAVSRGSGGGGSEKRSVGGAAADREGVTRSSIAVVVSAAGVVVIGAVGGCKRYLSHSNGIAFAGSVGCEGTAWESGCDRGATRGIPECVCSGGGRS